MTILVLVRGLPGSGKSTYAKTYPFLHYEADMYHMVKGEYKFVGENVKAAHEWCFTSTKVALNNGASVVVSNTFTRLFEMQKYIDLANDLSVQLLVYKCNGQHGSVHNVPEDVLKSMAARWEDYPGELNV